MMYDLIRKVGWVLEKKLKFLLAIKKGGVCIWVHL